LVVPSPRLLSIEVTNRCRKACWFCYARSDPAGVTSWTAPTLEAFVRDCAAHGVQSVSFGGGEPLEFPGLLDVITRLNGVVARTLTTHGLLLDEKMVDALVAAAPDKVHLSIHFPERVSEVERVIHQVHMLWHRGIRSGINLLVAASNLEAATLAARAIRSSGIDNTRVTYLPMRGQDTPTPAQLGAVAGGSRFQSMTCLTRCAPSERFVSIRSNQTVAWCSYTQARRALPTLDFDGLMQALSGLGLTFCGGEDGAR
jgi:sulfatase maturation enzyme AslB (radical SAM superfamily)